uniref:Hydrogenase maturation factor n=1 Tax=Magnetococcus massalia (strain MO-1) TaxID=451514 RepID=A0A1S7LDI3_MAGMO|nr:hydrogenase expression/formation protein [Candidatus Magnetococcus massalia]
MSSPAKIWLQRLQALPHPTQRVGIMNVCGGHERSITMAGLRGLLPDYVDLIPGPGCPVCICPEGDIHAAIRLGLEDQAIVVAFGDMLRVPINKKAQARSLEAAHAAGADIRPIASPMEAVAIAQQHADRNVVFFAAGFETTMAPVAAMLAQGMPENLSVWSAGRLTWPAVEMLLKSGDAGFDALVAPGHVATVMGPEEWSFVAEDFNLPTAVAGFEPDSLLAAFYSVLRQKQERRVMLDNCYPEVVRSGGNPMAKKLMAESFSVVDAPWRGIGTLPASGLAIAPAYAQWDARERFPHQVKDEGDSEMPPGCDCAGVVLGKIKPLECRLYETTCTPRSPVGPCMVSDEGACRIWWSGGKRKGDTVLP